MDASTGALAHHRRHRTAPGRDLGAAAAFAAVALAVAALGSLATAGATDSAWFEALDKPAWYPPSSAFGIVWTILYVMIAASGWLAWRAGATAADLAWWGGQMALNLAWSVVFFGLRRPGWAVVVIAALAVAIVGNLVAFARRDRLAAGLLVPYLAWVLFASALNVAIALAN